MSGGSAPCRALRVLHVLTTAQRRGAEVFATELDAALRARGVASRAVALRAAPAGEPALDVEILAGPGASMLGQVRALRAAARDVDVVVAHGSRSLDLAALATMGSTTRFVYRVIGEPAHWARSRAQRLRIAALLRTADAVVTYYDNAASQVRAHYGLRAERVEVIPKGIDLTRFAPPSAGDRAAARQRLGVAGVLVLALGALRSEKDVPLAIDATAALEGATLALVGDGDERASLAAHAAAIGVPLLLPGAVADPRPWLTAADVVLLTSRTEGVPGVLLEAAASGTPAVAVDVGGVACVVVDGVTGRLVSARAADAVAAALRDVLADRAALSRSARRWAEEHAGIAPVADRWAALLGRLVGPVS
jgi:glycosyltransferase involved in cell wall biosynthesis